MLHVDLDQFIAAVEILRHPELRGRPVVVGGDGDPAKRGVVSTASYEAREYGVHSGLPLRTAARRCPDAVFLPVDREEYEAASVTVMDTLRGFGAVTEVMGWDEAFVAVDTADPEGFARDIAAGIRAATQLDASVGIGQNKLQAKLATGFGKQAGVFRLTYETWFDVLGDRPTDALWGIGVKTARRLSGLGIATVSELARADPDALAAEFGPATGPWLVRLARGEDHSPVSSAPYVPRSRGREITFQADLAGWEQVQAEVVRLAERVSADVAAEGARRAGGGQGQVRAVLHLEPLPVAAGPHSRPGRHPGGSAGRAGAVHRPAPGPAARRTGRVRWLRAGPGSGLPAAQAPPLFPRLRAARMICVTSYRLSPSLRAISSGRSPCWLYRAASRRCDAVPGSRRSGAGAGAGPRARAAARAGAGAGAGRVAEAGGRAGPGSGWPKVPRRWS